MKKMWQGSYGLAVTFWLWWFVGNGVVATGLSMLPVPGIGFLTLLYFIASCVGVWRAGTEFDGPHAWVVLSRIMLFALPLLAIGSALLLVGAFFYMLTGLPH